MGERNCAFEGCNALEFRTSGYCLKHNRHTSEDGKNEIRSVDLEEFDMGKHIPLQEMEMGWVLSIIGIPLFFFGFKLLKSEPVTNWFEVLINPIIQLCGLASLFIGILFIMSPFISKYGYGFEGSSTPNVSSNSDTGMYHLLDDSKILEDIDEPRE